MKFEVDPSLKYEYGNLRNRLASSFNNPLGAAYNPAVKAAMLRSGNERLGQQEAQAYRQGQFDVSKLNYGKGVTLAELTKPQIVNTGGTSSGTMSGTMTTSQSPWGAIIGGAAQAAPLSL